jgi:serine/threonine-protein kinase
MATPQDRETVTQGNSLTPERFARVRAVFEAAVERPTAERRAFAAGACGGDAGLLREVERMLVADGRAGGVLDKPPSSSAPEEGRFPAGTVLAGRYRILGLLGHGGMGEVYKAFDLILNQTVALKFLAPAHYGEAALARFRNEVRIARQVAHPNVCRVYDLGMVEGLHFLSMEYIDGEDLASLLRRIGRLPQDKAIEFTRKICAGLSAAHERGVLHRDLKPANIMIDGRGQVRITDFGLAGLAAEIPLSDLRSGTPAYMSPEQKAGKEVTTRSDIYSLGLVLHEMFTGKARKDTQSSPSEIVKDLDPAIERLILRCLEEDPKRRPQTALNVAMALPGADPIAAALAAGETPSPEMVAASTEKEGFSARTAAICCTAAVLCLLVSLFIQSNYSFFARAPLPLPPDALGDRAKQLLSSLGYSNLPGVIDYGFDCCDRRAIENANRYERSRLNEVLASHQPPVVTFYFRWSPALLALGSALKAPNPFPDGSDVERSRISGAHLLLNANGKLIRLEIHPRDVPANPQVINWNTLFAAAGLDPLRFTPAVPEDVPTAIYDSRLAWTGSYADNRSERVHVEGASWQGRPVVFDVRVFPSDSTAPSAFGLILSGLGLLVLLAAGFTAWRNLRQGRSDRRGASVIAGFFLLVGLAVLVLGPVHSNVPFLSHSVAGLVYASAPTFLFAFLVWLAYIAIEPYCRRHWPDSLISWTRFTNGKIRNPLVASHLIVSVLGAEALAVAVHGLQFTKAWGSIVGITSSGVIGGGVIGGLVPAMTAALNGIPLALLFLVLVVLLRLLVRRMWIADPIAAFVLALLTGFGSRGLALLALLTLAPVIQIWVLRRFGFLAVISYFCLFDWAMSNDFTPSAWFAGRALAVQLVPVAIAAWALWVIVSGRQKSSAAMFAD